MAKSKFSYNESFEELTEIIEAINNGEVSIDDLQEKVKKARTLLKACQNKLRATEKEIDKIFD